jgi:hypothetical protein
MKNIVLKLFFLLMIIALVTVTNIGCKKGDEGIDITDGTWGLLLTSNSNTVALVYDFQGDQEQGNVYYSGARRGTYSVSGDIVNFTVNHYDEEDNLYLYTYSGRFIDYYNMSGAFYVTYPDGSIVSGTFTAER